MAFWMFATCCCCGAVLVTSGCHYAGGGIFPAVMLGFVADRLDHGGETTSAVESHREGCIRFILLITFDCALVLMPGTVRL